MHPMKQYIYLFICFSMCDIFLNILMNVKLIYVLFFFSQARRKWSFWNYTEVGLYLSLLLSLPPFSPFYLILAL